MELKVIKPFDWAHQGVRVESFAKDQVISTEDEDLIRVATDEKWVSKVRGGGEAKTQVAAPENKALTGAGENKGADGADGQAQI